MLTAQKLYGFFHRVIEMFPRYFQSIWKNQSVLNKNFL